MIKPKNIEIKIQNLEDTAIICSRRQDIRKALSKFDFSRPDSEEPASRSKVTVNVLKRSKTQEIQVNFKKFLSNVKCGCETNLKMLCNENKANCSNCGQFYGVLQVRNYSDTNISFLQDSRKTTKLIKTYREANLICKLNEPVSEIFKRMRAVSDKTRKLINPSVFYLSVSWLRIFKILVISLLIKRLLFNSNF